jgi:hypothetical protein
MSKLFALAGIVSPGRVNLKNHGTVNLEDIPDELAIELFKSGCPFLYPTKEYFELLYPKGMPVEDTDNKVPDVVMESNFILPQEKPSRKRATKK